MKRRETKSWEQDAGRSPLVRAGLRWRAFARGLARGARRSLLAADTLGFVESLYGVRFKTVEGDAFSFDKVYRTNSGRRFVSETRLDVSVHPRFDLRFVNVAHVHAVTQLFKGGPATTSFTLLSHKGARVRERELIKLLHTHAAAPSLTIQQWNVSTPFVERPSHAFGHVTVRVQRVQDERQPEPSRNAERFERLLREREASSPGVETSRPASTPEPASLRLTNINLRHYTVNAPRHEFVHVLFSKYLPAIASREALNAREAAELLTVPARRARAQRETERRFVNVPDTQGRLFSTWTYATPSTRRVPGDAIEVRREFRSTETLREQVPARGPRPLMLHVLSPESLLLSFNLSESAPTSIAGAAGHVTYQLNERAPLMTLQQVRTRSASRDVREASAFVHAVRSVEQAPQPLPSMTREVLSSLSTFVRHVQPFVANVMHAGHTTNFTWHGFESVSQRVFQQMPARRREASNASAQGRVTTRELLGRTVEFVRPASVTVFSREAFTNGTDTQTTLEGRRDFFSTQSVGAGTFLFVNGLMRRSGAAASAALMSPTVATALRPVATAEEAERTPSETRAARPEGMALELIRQRREQVLQLPRQGYVFTQTPRAQLEERQVITKASREEIVEVVRKEMRSLNTAAHAAVAPSRAEIAAVAEEVYTTLARRLLVERERLGRF